MTAPVQDIPRAGQPVLALHPGKNEPNRCVLFPIETTPHSFSCSAPPDHLWRAGDELDLVGPIGAGFRPPPASRRWLLMSIDNEPEPLMPLIGLAGERDASISLWARAIPSDLSPDVEVATDLAGSLDWADFLAICTTPSGLTELRSLLHLGEGTRIRAHTQALIMGPMPCGIGGCMACAVRARRGWKLSCLDGPVFPLEALAW